jgi:hypothetical protein
VGDSHLSGLCKDHLIELKSLGSEHHQQLRAGLVERVLMARIKTKYQDPYS